MIETYYNYCGISYQPGPTFVLSEGDFHNKSRRLEKRIRASATHVVASLEDLNKGLVDCRNTLDNEIFPGIADFSSLENFQKSIIDDPSKITFFDLPDLAIVATIYRGEENLQSILDFIYKEYHLHGKGEEFILGKLWKNAISFQKQILHD
jgi:hypothetical protein